VKASRFAGVQVRKEINVERDPDAAKDIVRKTGQAGVPVIICAI
jgi:hypothetical protein